MRLAVCVAVVLCLLGGVCVAASGGRQDEQKFSRRECRWAVAWINGPLELLMAHGIIENISCRDDKFAVLAGDGWRTLSFGQAGEVLKKLSRAREITGHAACFSVQQAAGDRVPGMVTKESIRVLLPGEGYFEYLPAVQDRENTVH